MSLILSGTEGVADVDGSAATPAIRGTDANTGIFFPAADTIAFSTAGTEDARFDASGNLGVGTTAPANYGTAFIRNISAVLADQNVTVGAYFQAGVDQFGFINSGTVNNVGPSPLVFQTGGIERARINSSGNLLVGSTNNPNNAKILGEGVGDNVGGEFYRPGVGGSSAVVTFLSNVGGTRALKSYIDTAGALVSTSDARLKENVQAFDAGLDCVLGLNPVYFNWKGDASTQAGFIAQEVEQVLPIAVREMQSNGLEDMRTLDKNVLFPVLVKAIQEQQALITAQQAIITALTARVEALEGAQK